MLAPEEGKILVAYKTCYEELWRGGLLRHKLWPQQKPIYDSVKALPFHVSLVVILCARQFGKSFLGVLMALEDCIKYPGRCILIMGPTIKQAIDIVAPRVRDITLDSPKGLVRRSKSESKWYVGDSELVIGGFDQDSSSQRGKTVQNIYIEEVVDSNPDQYVESMKSDLGPALTHSKGGKMIFMTTPPKIPDHPFILETIPQAQRTESFYRYTIYDNAELDEIQFNKCVELAGGKDTTDFKREYLCEIVRDANIMVVPNFSEDMHVKEFSLPRHAFYQIAVDWGGVRDHTAALLHYYEFSENRHYVWEERHWPPHTPTKDIVAGLLELEKGLPIHQRIIDAPAQVIIDLNETFKYECTIPRKDDWLAAVNNMCVKFSLCQIAIRPRCQYLIMSLRSGTFNRNKTDFERTLTLGHCDAIAALMYGIRCMDTANPFPTFFTPGGMIYNREDPIQMDNVKVFQEPKKFGRFR